MKNQLNYKKGFISGHLTESRNISLRDSGKPNKLIIFRVAKAKKQKSGI